MNTTITTITTITLTALAILAALTFTSPPAQALGSECRVLSAYSATIMLKRQRGAPQYALMSNLRRGLGTSGLGLRTQREVLNLIPRAYRHPRYYNARRQLGAIQNFSREVYLTCLEDQSWP